MNSRKLWEERERGEGDVELRVNGAITSAHWMVLKTVPYFKLLDDREKYMTDEVPPRCLEIDDNSLSLEAIIDGMRYIYTDHCFTDNTDKSGDAFKHFCRFIQSQTLALASFNNIVNQITKCNCVDCHILGTAFNLIPLKRKAWKKAIENNWLHQVEEMITPRVNVDVLITRELQTALHISIEKGYLSLAHTLLSAGADVNRADYQGQTPLGLSVWYGYIELAEALLNCGAAVNTTDQYKQTPLHKACAKGLCKIVELLIRHNAEINLQSHDGYTPLHIAATGGHRDVVIVLLTAGAAWQLGRQQLENIEWPLTALHMATMKGHPDLVRQLLRQCCGIQEGRTDCLTPLHTAVVSGYCDVMQILIEHGMPVNAQDWEGRSPLHYAARSGNVEAIEILVKAGAHLYKQDKLKMTCLHLAAIRNHSNAVTALLRQQSCPLNVVDRDGLTALHYAAENKNTNMVRELLKAGTVPTILSKDGRIAKNLVGKKIQLDTLKFLIMVQA